MRRLFIFLSLLFLSQNSFGISEENYKSVYENDVKTYFSSRANRFAFPTLDPSSPYINAFTLIKDKNNPTILIAGGRRESYMHYIELMYDFRDLPYNFVGLDWRGQGLNARELEDPQIGYVKSYLDYVNDLNAFLSMLTLKRDRPLYFLGHSMGAHIVTRHEQIYGPKFDKLIFSAPMFHINTGKYHPSVAYLLVAYETIRGNGTKFARGQGPYDHNRTLDESDVTRSIERFQMKRDTLKEYPQIALGGPSNNWVLQTFKSNKLIRKSIKKIEAPVLILQAGREVVVKNPIQNKLCKRISRCKLVSFPESYHEVLQERDFIRDRALQTIKEFLAEK